MLHAELYINYYVSMVHHYLECKTTTGQQLFLHVDIAVGQNENNTVVRYIWHGECFWVKTNDQAFLHTS